MIFYSIFRGRVQRLIAEMEAAATHLVALLASQYKRSAATPVSQPAGGPPSGQQPVSPYPTQLEPDYFSEYSIKDRTIDPQGL